MIHEGDICEAGRDIDPVEILYIDMAKRRSTFQCIVDRFYRRLIPGQTLLIHQDFGRPRLAWLHYGAGYLMPYFEVAAAPVDATLLLRLVNEIPAEVVARLMNDDFSTEEKLHYVAALRPPLYAVMEKRGEQRVHYEAILNFATAYVYYWDGHYLEAERRADQLENNAFLRHSFQFMFKEIRSRGTMFQ